MRRFAVVLVAAFLVAPIYARDSGQKRIEDLECDGIESVAGFIMRWRLDGVPASEVMEDVQRGGLGHEIVKDAYSRDREILKSAKEAAINDFKSQWYLRCIEADE